MTKKPTAQEIQQDNVLKQQTIDLEKLKKMASKFYTKPTDSSEKPTTNDELLIADMDKVLSLSMQAEAGTPELDNYFNAVNSMEDRFKKAVESPQQKLRGSISAEKEVHEALALADKIEFYFKSLQPYLKMAQPINNWRDVNIILVSHDFKNMGFEEVVNEEDLKYSDHYTEDKTTGSLYASDDNSTLRKKLFLLSLGTCTVNLIALLAHSMYRLAKIISVYELRNPNNSTITNLKNYGSDIARLVFGPLVLLGMQITAVLGTITPAKDGTRDARKMYALGESLIFGFGEKSWRLAPCFRPDPKYHFFGGKIGKKNEW